MELNLKIRMITSLLSTGLLLSGAVKAQTCDLNMALTSPLTRFTTNGNGTVTDDVTGLTWMRCGLGLTWDGTNCNGSLSRLNWKAALEAAESQIFAGSSDWRLPNIKELASIIEHSCHYPANNLTIFPEVTSWSSNWTSSINARSALYAWSINFTNGDESRAPKSSYYHVRLVRGGISHAPLNNAPIITNQPRNLGCTNGDTLNDVVALSGITATDVDGDALTYTPSVNNDYVCSWSAGSVPNVIPYTIEVTDEEASVTSNSFNIYVCPTGSTYNPNNNSCY